ncbi:MAG: hypothetical protein ABIF88_04050 [archaeon]
MKNLITALTVLFPLLLSSCNSTTEKAYLMMGKHTFTGRHLDTTTGTGRFGGIGFLTEEEHGFGIEVEAEKAYTKRTRNPATSITIRREAISIGGRYTAPELWDFINPYISIGATGQRITIERHYADWDAKANSLAGYARVGVDLRVDKIFVGIFYRLSEGEKIDLGRRNGIDTDTRQLGFTLGIFF